jgi:AraC family transcriptional regulator
MQKNLAINPPKKSVGLKISPDEQPLVSSFDAGWNNIHLESYLLTANECPEHSPEQNVIAIFHRPLKVLKKLLGDEAKDICIKTGDVVIMPASVAHSACWDEEALVTFLYLEPEFVAHAAYEFIKPDRVEILPHFAQSDPVIYEIGRSLRSKLEADRAVNQMYVDSAAAFLASHLLENYCADKNNIEENTNALSCKDLQQVVDYIEAHLDWDLGLTELANLVDMSHHHFSRLFKKSMGVAPHRYLIERRIERVTHLLVSTNLGIAEIAKLTGFSSHSHLCLTFRKHLSVTPDRYRTDICAKWRFKN